VFDRELVNLIFDEHRRFWMTDILDSYGNLPVLFRCNNRQLPQFQHHSGMDRTIE
jgi:hypothetical protein